MSRERAAAGAWDGARAPDPRLHPAAAVGFDAAADRYQRGRPGYAQDAVDHLAAELRIGPGRTVVDVGAGTGKLTELVAATGATVLAVEPVAGMREVLRRRLPDVRVVDAVAEELPFDAGSVDAVVAAQAFHWFDGDRALSEWHRVLRPGGGVGLVWNERDLAVPWVARITATLDEYRDTPRASDVDWERLFERDARYAPLRRREFRYAHRTTTELVVERYLSVSFVAAAPPDVRDEVERRVRAVLADDAATAGRDELVHPYITIVHWTTRRP